MSAAAVPAARLGLRAYALLALVALAMFLPGQTNLPAMDRDETRYAVSTTQMLQSGDWMDIHYQDRPRYLQPIGIYWLQALSVTAFSSPGAKAMWAFRLPSLISATAAVPLTAAVADVAFGAGAAIGAGLLMAMCLLLGFEAHMAKIDATLLASILVAQGALMRAYLGRVRGAGRLNAAAFWAAVGVGLMLKGPIILIVSGTTALALLAVDRRFAWLKRLHAGWGVLIALAIALPWLIAIGVKTHGAFFAKAVGQNLLGKIGRGEQAHGQPPGYYLAAFNLTFWPSSLAAVLALPWIWRSRGRPEVRFLIAWTLPTWLIYEAIATKLPHYALPVYPAIACLAAAAATAPGGWRFGWTGRALMAVYGALWLVVGCALVSLGAYLIWRLEHRLDPIAIGAAVVAVALVLTTAAEVIAGRRVAAAATALAAMWVASTTFYVHSLPSNRPLWLARRIAATVQPLKPCPTTVLASSAFTEPSLVFEAGVDTRLLRYWEAADFLAKDPRCGLALIGSAQIPAFLARARADGVMPASLARVAGVNYSTGKRLDLILFRVSPAR